MMRLVTWNINSVRLRVEQALRLLIDTQADVLCLQELKAATEKFPHEAFREIGYGHTVVQGQPGYNGVAFVSKHPIQPKPAIDFGQRGEARHASASLSSSIGEITLHGVYTPAGGDTPDVETNDKFAQKLAFLDEMAERFVDIRRAVLMGDLNVAPLEQDVWSHKQMLSVVSHTPIEVEKFTAAQHAGPWIDAPREFTPPEQPLFSWWSYRARDWRASNRGRRLDHIWVSTDLQPHLSACTVIEEARGWEKPSDHAPVLIDLAL